MQTPRLQLAAPAIVGLISPAGPHEARVGTSVEFEAQNFNGAVEWAVDGVPGGALGIGSIADGLYVAPPRSPSEGAVVVSATNAVNPRETAGATVTITAAGTVYVLDESIAMAGAPALDLAFISTVWGTSRVVRVNGLSTATGEVTGTDFSTLTYDSPTGLAYDRQRDVLYALVEGALIAYHGASTAPAGTEPARVITGPSIAALFTADGRLALDAENDRIFFSDVNGLTLGTYDDASLLVGEVAPDRTIALDAPISFFWGLDYDASRDELYVGDQKPGTGVYVVVIDADADDVKIYDNASTLNGDVPPTRVIGGALLPIDYPYGGFVDLGQ